MAKRKKQVDSQIEAVRATAIEPPKPLEFEARPCSMCQTYRPHGKSYSRVYCTRGRIRYCKCDFCGNTWSQEGK